MVQAKRIFLTLAFLIGCSNPTQDQNAYTPPSTYNPPSIKFDLTNWKLQLPQASNGGVQEIDGSALQNEYASPYFYLTPDSAMTFWCPVNGATTEGSHYPRSELREVKPGGDWTFAGTHTLSAKCRVLHLPNNGRVIIGQIHGHLLGGEIIKLLWSKGEIEADVEPDRSSQVGLPLGHFNLGDTLHYEINMQDGKLEVLVNGTSVSYDYTSDIWKNDTYYFKAGDYVQDNVGTSNEGGVVAFYSLSTEHKP